MRKFFLFMMVSVDGYFEGPDHDISWHNVDSEFSEFVHGQDQTIGTLVFGHRTYDLMASFWPNPQGMAADAETARFMNATPKIVASKRPFTADWENTTIASGSGTIVGEVKKLKEQDGKDIAIFGSNMLCVSLMEAGLVDEFRIMVNPVALGRGTSLFAGLSKKTNFKLSKTREFKSGNVLFTFHSPYIS
jgi:dihydrofolate reductase